MRVPRSLLPALTTGLLAGCVAAAPPPLAAFPGHDKTFAMFQQDDTACRRQTPAVAAAGPPATALSYLQCMASRDNLVMPVPAGSMPAEGVAAFAYGSFYGVDDPLLYGPAFYPGRLGYDYWGWNWAGRDVGWGGGWRRGPGWYGGRGFVGRAGRPGSGDRRGGHG